VDMLLPRFRGTRRSLDGTRYLSCLVLGMTSKENTVMETGARYDQSLVDSLTLICTVGDERVRVFIFIACYVNNSRIRGRSSKALIEGITARFSPARGVGQVSGILFMRT
jgi:hypothetical protein